MKHLFIIFATIACFVTAHARVSTATRVMLAADKALSHKQKPPIPLLSDKGIAKAKTADDSDAVQDPESPYLPLILQVDGEETVDSLKDLGVIIYNQREQLLLTSIPREFVDDALNLDGVLYAATCGNLCVNMDYARPFGRVDIAQEGLDGLPEGYGGEGVLVGFSDIGFDANHIAFDGRIAAFSDYDSMQGIVRKASTPEQIAQMGTDTDENFHATHVANILAGAYKGNSYYGVAPKAEIFATTSRLHDVGILAGVEDIIAYGKSQNKPTVINLSLSSYLGPHDGTDLLCQYLSSCAQEAVICIAAGNNGLVKGYASQNLSQGQAQVAIDSRTDGTSFEVSGMTDLWSATNQPFEICVGIYDTDAKEIIYQTPWMTGDFECLVDAESDPQWGRYMDGTIIYAAELCPLNDRYNAAVWYETSTTEQSSRGAWSRYRSCICARAIEGADPDIHIDIFADASLSVLGSIAGSTTQIGSQASINDMCTADGVIAVGMATSRNSTPLLDGETKSWSVEVDMATPYSSYNITPYIERLPHIAAPGAYVVSAMSTPYALAHPDVMMAAESTVDGKEYYWYATGGTSMSSPFVAGVAALWLEADLTLTAKEILEIMRICARKDFSDIDDPRWGAGCIDAALGLKYIIDPTALPDCSTTPTSDDNVYTLQGLPVKNPARPGIYIKGNKKYIVK